MIEILIADDHALVRRGLRLVLQDLMEPVLIGEAGSGHEALRRALSEPWDLLILDLNLPDANGLQLLRALKRHKPGLPVVVLSMLNAVPVVRQSFRYGAAAYVTKNSPTEELLRAITAALRGGHYLSRDFAGQPGLDPDAPDGARDFSPN